LQSGSDRSDIETLTINIISKLRHRHEYQLSILRVAFKKISIRYLKVRRNACARKDARTLVSSLKFFLILSYPFISTLLVIPVAIFREKAAKRGDDKPKAK